MKKLLILICMTAAIVSTALFVDKFTVEARETPLPEAEAKCAVTSFKNSLTNSAAIFVGTVVGVREDGDKKIFQFRVQKYWKGIKGKTIEVYVFQTIRYPASYQMDKKYLVYAEKDDDGKLRDRRCSRSGEIGYQNSIADMKLLGRGKTVR